jgi:hypothetical protein
MDNEPAARVPSILSLRHPAGGIAPGGTGFSSAARVTLRLAPDGCARPASARDQANSGTGPRASPARTGVFGVVDRPVTR